MSDYHHLKASEMKIIEFVDSIASDKTAHLEMHCLPSIVLIVNTKVMIFFCFFFFFFCFVFFFFCALKLHCCTE